MSETVTVADHDSRPRRRPTLRMVAELAGVSTATVSYVFSGRHGGESGVAPATTQRVLDAADQLNYRPNRAARAIRTGKTGMIQLSLHMLSDPWSLAVAEAVNAASKPHGLTTLILADGDWSTALDRVESDVAYVGVPVDLVDESREKLRTLVARGQRLVVFCETLEPDGFDVVRSDALPGCALVMDHLLERHTQIGCLTGESQLRASVAPASRYTVYLERMAAAGLDVDPSFTVTYEDHSKASALTSAIQLLSGDRRPTAVFATTDFAAIAAMNAAHMLGLRVPHDVAIAGVGNAPEAQQVIPTLTTVGPSDLYERQAELIVERALEQVPSPPRLLDFPWTLIPGGSTDLDAPPLRRPGDTIPR
ncbi:LacI family DNA-binding transcriptional regulator [Microbacterium sp. P5_E9]